MIGSKARYRKIDDVRHGKKRNFSTLLLGHLHFVASVSLTGGCLVLWKPGRHCRTNDRSLLWNGWIATPICREIIEELVGAMGVKTLVKTKNCF